MSSESCSVESAVLGRGRWFLAAEARQCCGVLVSVVVYGQAGLRLVLVSLMVYGEAGLGCGSGLRDALWGAGRLPSGARHLYLEGPRPIPSRWLDSGAAGGGEALLGSRVSSKGGAQTCVVPPGRGLVEALAGASGWGPRAAHWSGAQVCCAGCVCWVHPRGFAGGSLGRVCGPDLTRCVGAFVEVAALLEWGPLLVLGGTGGAPHQMIR